MLSTTINSPRFTFREIEPSIANMALPRGTNLSITISCCEGLPSISYTDQRISRRDAEEQVQIAADFLQSKYREAAQSRDLSAAIRRDVENANERLERARTVLRNVENSGQEVVAPNPFAILCAEGEEYNGRPMLETKVVRETRDPIWRESLDCFPLERYLTTGRSLSNGRTYNLVFYIYHDDAVPDRDYVPRRSDPTWRRATPRRSVCIGRATWAIQDIRRKVGDEEFCRKIPVFDPYTNRRIRGAMLTIKAEVWQEDMY